MARKTTEVSVVVEVIAHHLSTARVVFVEKKANNLKLDPNLSKEDWEVILAARWVKRYHAALEAIRDNDNKSTPIEMIQERPGAEEVSAYDREFINNSFRRQKLPYIIRNTGPYGRHDVAALKIFKRL